MVALPNEVLYQIFAELEDRLPLERWHMYGAHLDHQGSATLRNLCLVCRQFRHIAQPLLYRTVITEGRDSARTVETLLLRTFVEDPHLGEQVRTVSLTDNADHSAKMDVLGEAARKEIIRSAWKSLSLPSALKRYMKENHHMSCGFAALVIAYMPLVQVVDCTTEGLAVPFYWLLSTRTDMRRPVCPINPRSIFFKLRR